MKARALPHKPDKKKIHKFEKKMLDLLPKFRTSLRNKLYKEKPRLIGEFIERGLSLAHVGYLKGLPLNKIRDRLMDTANIAEKACLAGYGFKNPYEYYMTWWLGILLEHKKLIKALNRVSKDKRGLMPFDYLVEGMIPDMISVLREFSLGTRKKKEKLGALEAFLKINLGEPSRVVEARRYEPLVVGLDAIMNKDSVKWNKALKKRKERWIKEASKYPGMAWFILDIELLGLMQLAKDGGLKLKSDNPYAPPALLEAKGSKRRIGLGKSFS